jgi:hypothetical protein
VIEGKRKNENSKTTEKKETLKNCEGNVLIKDKTFGNKGRFITSIHKFFFFWFFFLILPSYR